MPHLATIRRDRGSVRGGFSLIEVVIAIGVMAFAMTAMIALLSVGMTSSRDSTSDTTLGDMATFMLNNMRATNAATNWVDGTTTTNYFDESGGYLTDSPTNAFYRCQSTLSRSAATNSNYGNQLWEVSLIFTWPPPFSSTNNSNVVHATLTQYY
jgi:uncharacterized protein (TIGR02598 family)